MTVHLEWNNRANGRLSGCFTSTSRQTRLLPSLEGFVLKATVPGCVDLQQGLHMVFLDIDLCDIRCALRPGQIDAVGSDRRNEQENDETREHKSKEGSKYLLTSLCIRSTFLCMKRTTLTIEDDLFVQLKKHAASQGKSMRSLVNDLLRQAISIQSRRKSFRLELDGWDADLQPGVDILDRDKLFDLMNGR